MARSTVHYADNNTNKILKALHKKLRPAGTPVQRVEYIIELLLLRIFEVKLKHDSKFKNLRKIFQGNHSELLFSNLFNITNEHLLKSLNTKFFPFYSEIIKEVGNVTEGNLENKVKDQLVLIEEVFSNSNFSNNVKSGNLKEIIGLIGEIEEERLFKTDLLGDAIESALSETGGTKDLGLFRTPDHIRRFMVGMIQPTIEDTIFDPACGTAGFLYDAFEFVMQGYKKDNSWPGEKSHPELKNYFDDYFKNKDFIMPDNNKSMEFYRSGIGGIEYLGMIRKMASVNLFIRGLNPGTIEQGDSLALYKPTEHENTKSVILANPPFGADRDQEAYPEVWEEYSKESETTILFVKLMLNYLKPGGRCAVIVSEGFLTWDQGSARALRKILLEEANIKAIISLPQGVFVSKNGQGPKTSIIIFEKTEPTKNIWFYKVTNDGFSMGTNRKPIKNSQLIEALEIYNNYVKVGKTPPETTHSYLIPADWIKVLDPRIKIRIRKETHEKLEKKRTPDRAKFVKKLDLQLKKKSITKFNYEMQLNQFDENYENKIQLEMAKNIEKAHLYSYNIPNYRSSLSSQQIEKWYEILLVNKKVKIENLDYVYSQLQNINLNLSENLLAQLNPKNSLEFDISREFISKLNFEDSKIPNNLIALNSILIHKQKFPFVKLERLIKPKFNKIKKADYNGKIDIVSKISFKDGKIHFRDIKATGMDLYKADKFELVTSKINLHQGAIALAMKELVCSTHYQIYEIMKNDINPNYLIYILRSNEFKKLINTQKTNGIKTEQGSVFLSKFSIPLPKIDPQNEFVKEIEKQKSIITGANLLIKNYSYSFSIEKNVELQPIGNAVIGTKNGWSPQCNGGNIKVLKLSCLKYGAIDFNEIKFTDRLKKNIHNYFVKEKDFFYSRGNTPELVALAGIAYNINENIVFPDLLTRVYFDESKILPEYAIILFNSKFGRHYFSKVPKGAAPNMVKVSQGYMKSFKVPYMENIEKQKQIITNFKSSLELISKLEKIKSEAFQEIDSIINNIWQTE